MGLNPFWQEDVLLTVQDFFPATRIFQTQPYFIIQCGNDLFIHLIPLAHPFDPAALVALQEDYRQRNIQLVQLWEDVWLAKRAQVLSRLHSFLGMNKSLHGRKTAVITIDQNLARTFLNNYHIQGFVNAAHFYGLVLNHELIAVAGFSRARPMKDKGNHYLSAELVRFASKDGCTVVGGLSKLIKYFLGQTKVHDLMTYADRDWSLGKGYGRIGFSLSGTTPPAYLFVHRETLVRHFAHRLPKELLSDFDLQKTLTFDDYLASKGWLKVFNTGNLRYYLYL